MIGEEAVFPKQIKFDDYEPFEQGNIIRMLESSNLLLGPGARSSNASVVLAKTLHYMQDESLLTVAGKNVLELGAGVGLVGIYLACLGSKVVLSDLPVMRDMAERNIGLNRKMIKGKADFVVGNWKKVEEVGKGEKMEDNSSTSSDKKEENLMHLVDQVDLTVVCECGGLQDFKCQLRLMGKQGLIVCFLQRPFSQTEDCLSARPLEQYLLDTPLHYQRIESYHPDYYDERVCIYHIFK